MVCCGAHPFHLCVGQMKWNADSKLWELSIRLHPQDLENALTKELFSDKPERRASIDDDNFPAVATKYLDHCFYLRRTPIAMNRVEFKAVMESNQSNDWVKSVAVSTTKSEASPVRSSLKWIGMEQERGWLWIHLELTPPAMESETQKLWMVNRILIDSVERQENTVAIDPASTKKFHLQFRAGNEFQEFKPAK